MAFTGGAWGLTSEGSASAFALVRPANASDPDLAVNPFGPREFDGVSDRFGAAVARLRAYSTRDLIIRPLTDRDGFTAPGRQVQATLGGPYRAGFLVDVAEADYETPARDADPLEIPDAMLARPVDPEELEDEGPLFYTVRPGDTLYGIGITFGVRLDSIRRANDLDETATLVEPGTVLLIPPQ